MRWLATAGSSVPETFSEGRGFRLRPPHSLSASHPGNQEGIHEPPVTVPNFVTVGEGPDTMRSKAMCCGHQEERWWRRRGLNPRPPRCERGALPAELLPHLRAGKHSPRFAPVLSIRARRTARRGDASPQGASPVASGRSSPAVSSEHDLRSSPSLLPSFIRQRNFLTSNYARSPPVPHERPSHRGPPCVVRSNVRAARGILSKR